MRVGEGRTILSSLLSARSPGAEDGNEEDVLNLHSQRLSFTLFVKQWWAPIISAFATYGVLLTAQPPRDSAESAYFFLFPAIVWFSFEPNIRKVAITFLFAGWLYYMTLVGWIRHVTLPGMICATFLLSPLDSPSNERQFFGKIAGYGWPFFGLGCDRVGSVPVHLGFSMVSLVRHSMGEAGHSSDASLGRGLERFLLPCVFQSCSRFLRPSLAGSKEKWQRRDAFLLLPGF